MHESMYGLVVGHAGASPPLPPYREDEASGYRRSQWPDLPTRPRHAS